MKPTYASMAMINEQAACLVSLPLWSQKAACESLQILRLDKLHPFVSGNKWFKLKHHLSRAKNEKKNTILSLGGGHSNHLLATAFAAQYLGLKSIGMVRGHYAGEQLTDTLKYCRAAQMQLVFLNKQEYALARTGKGPGLQFPDAYIIPEGGFSEEGIQGAAEMADFIPAGTTDVCIAVGSGTSFLGLRRGLPATVRLHGFYVARDFERALTMLDTLPPNLLPVSRMHRVACDRFGKWNLETEHFIQHFFTTTGIPLDVVYTAKMMMALESLLAAGHFESPARIVCFHTGGLKGNPVHLRF
ncbi:MAG: pyridoxal-phosphate dependent enzyme [Bacteroidetes bacterium]|nr:pyridoxal-phosphate dependent enzyme [Bacteroidota bacterium]MBS1628515.1 pyridoxal-phosphate dependent enzyme [Bacteroidota bacterium]